MDRIRRHGAHRINRILCIILLLSALVTAFSGCSGGGDRFAVYEDMKEAFEKAGLLSANIGLFSKTEKDGSVSYGECGSGVIFAKYEDGYYALTAAHVVSVEKFLPRGGQKVGEKAVSRGSFKQNRLISRHNRFFHLFQLDFFHNIVV